MGLVPAIAPAGRSWTLVFDDEFNGTKVDTTKWADHSSAEADAGHGNLGNQQLEWNSFNNISVDNGALSITAKRESYTSEAGNKYHWTSGLLSSSPSFAFQYGYIEERALLPAEKGFWPAFWTWQQPGGNSWQETDVYEYYSDNPSRLYLTSHVGSGGNVIYNSPFNPSTAYHTYGADIRPTGTTFYIDGVAVGSVAGAPSAPTNIITNLAVYSKIQPDSTTVEATKKVDYVRAYSYDTDAKAVVPQPGYDGPGANQPTPTPNPTPMPIPTPTPTPGDWQTTPAATKTLYGKSWTETMRGTSGNDKFVGNGGEDTMFGGIGHDTYLVNSNGDKVIEYAGQGTDLIILSSSSHTMRSNIENLTIDRDAGATVFGNSLNNIILGDIGRDFMTGGFGRDNMTGGGGNDTFVFHKGEVAGDLIKDFRGNGTASGDVLRFEGFGEGAKLVHQGEAWTVKYSTGSETFFLVGVSTLAAGDVVFV